jgi:hypothetical protein
MTMSNDDRSRDDPDVRGRLDIVGEAADFGLDPAAVAEWRHADVVRHLRLIDLHVAALVASRDALRALAAAHEPYALEAPAVQDAVLLALARGDASVAIASTAVRDTQRRVWEVEEMMVLEGHLGASKRTVVRRERPGGALFVRLTPEGRPYVGVTDDDPPEFVVFEVA